MGERVCGCRRSLKYLSEWKEQADGSETLWGAGTIALHGICEASVERGIILGVPGFKKRLGTREEPQE